jgi:predicted house-cleaning noncanonical NTP pyrophosphatase (MazG superfamily)
MNKLVRDFIPASMRAEGKRPKLRRLEQHQRLEALLNKLEEETQELRDAPSLEEAVDVLEVLLAITQELEADANALEAARVKKREARGGFELGWMLEGFEDGTRRMRKR